MTSETQMAEIRLRAEMDQKEAESRDGAEEGKHPYAVRHDDGAVRSLAKLLHQTPEERRRRERESHDALLAILTKHPGATLFCDITYSLSSGYNRIIVRFPDETVTHWIWVYTPEHYRNQIEFARSNGADEEYIDYLKRLAERYIAPWTVNVQEHPCTYGIIEDALSRWLKVYCPSLPKPIIRWTEPGKIFVPRFA